MSQQRRCRRILQIIRYRVLRLLRQKRVIEDDSVNADEAVMGTEPALAEFAVASTLDSVPAGSAAKRAAFALDGCPIT